MFSFSPKTNKHNAASPHSFIPPGMAGWFHAHTPMHKARFLLLWPVLSPLSSASCLQPLISGDLPCSSAVTQVVPEAPPKPLCLLQSLHLTPESPGLQLPLGIPLSAPPPRAIPPGGALLKPPRFPTSPFPSLAPKPLRRCPLLPSCGEVSGTALS